MRVIGIVLILSLVWSTGTFVHSEPGKAPVDGTVGCAPPSLTDPHPWLPQTSPAGTSQPARHPASDCPFYQAAWQRFLIVTQPDGLGRPPFLGFKGPNDLFDQPKANKPVCADEPVLNGGVFQAKSHRILVDRFGHPVYYDIRADEGFKTFLSGAGLKTTADLKDPAKLGQKFSPGVVELKSAWQIVDPAAPPSKYFTTKACVPEIAFVNGQFVETGKLRSVTVAMLALHVVFSLDGHPELVWSTFEHIDADSGLRDNAPEASANPGPVTGDPEVCTKDYPLCAAHSHWSVANERAPDDYAAHFDPQTQTFNTGGVVFSTPVYRLYPGSKSDTAAADKDVVDLDKNMRMLFTQAGTQASDKRQFYQLVGAIWLDDPSNLAPGQTFSVDEGDSTDDQTKTPLAGEGRLSSTAMESFTQDPGTGFPNCFSCHDTSKINSDPPNSRLLMRPGTLNVSHLISKYLSDNP